MIHRFVPDVLKVPKPTVELVHEHGHYVTNIENPPANPKDRIIDEYGEDDSQSE